MQWLIEHWTIIAFVGGVIFQWAYNKRGMEAIVETINDLKKKLDSADDEISLIKLNAVREQQKVGSIESTVAEMKQMLTKVYDAVLTIKRNTSDN